MKLSDLGDDFDVISQPSSKKQTFADFGKTTLADKGFDKAQSNLAFSQSTLDRIRTGQAQQNVEVAKGFGKGALSTFSQAGAQAAGPVGAEMLRGAPAFAQNIQQTEQAVTPQNPLQAEGFGMEKAGEFVLPIPIAKATNVGPLAARQVQKVSKATGISDFLSKRSLEKAVRAISPKLTSGEMEAAPNVIKPRFRAPRVDYSKDKTFMQMAEDVKGLVKGRSAIDDKNALRSAIENVSESQVKPLLAQNKVPANFEDLQKKLSLVHPQSSLKADPSAAKTYGRVREEVQSSLYNSLKEAAKRNGDFSGNVDFNEVWDSRKILDAKAEEELGSKVFGTPEYTGARSAIQDMRQALTQYIKDSIQFPGQMEDVNRMQEFLQVARQRGIEIGSKDAVRLMQQMGIKASTENMAVTKAFEDAMRKISNYYKAVENVSTKVPDEIRRGGLLKKTFKNPFLQAGIGGGLVSAGVAKATND